MGKRSTYGSKKNIHISIVASRSTYYRSFRFYFSLRPGSSSTIYFYLLHDCSPLKTGEKMI